MRNVCVVTGAARGIGSAIALHMAGCGYAIAFCDNAPQHAIQCFEKQLRDKGADVLAVSCDITQERQVEDFIRDAAGFGSLCVLVNNAGITRDGLMVRMSECNFCDVIDVNLKGAFLVTKYAAKYMMKQKHGKIINISSVVGISGNAGQANYAASKAGLIGFTKACAKELGTRNITVNAIAPGYIQTEMTHSLPEEYTKQIMEKIPLRRFGSVQDVAGVVAFLASDAANYITGQVLTVDGGLI